MKEDSELLKEYCEENSDEAFAEIVGRHLDLVYSVAFRQVGGNEALARDVSQEVFTRLSREASELSDGVVLSGWLYRCARFVALNAMRTERRRRNREMEAHRMHEICNEGLEAEISWEHARPLLDEAISELHDLDRAAICLRFFEKRSFPEIGSRLSLSENASRMRVNRALDKLNGFLIGKGIRSTSIALGVALVGQSAMAAPVGLSGAIIKAIPFGASVVAGSSTLGTIVTFMNTAKITLGWTSLLAALAVGTALYQMDRAEGVERELLVLQSQARPVGDLDVELDALRSKLADLDDEYSELSSRKNPDVNEVAPHGFTALEMETAMEAWVTSVANLIEFVSLNEELRIPEFDLLEAEDWLAAVEEDKLETVADYRLLLAKVRQNAKQKVYQSLTNAFIACRKNAKGDIPNDAYEIYEFSDNSFDPAILSRYDVGKLGDFLPQARTPARQVLFETRPADRIWEDVSFVGPRISSGYSSRPGGRKWQPVSKALTAFMEEYERPPVDSEELEPFVKGEIDFELYEEIFSALTTPVTFDSE